VRAALAGICLLSDFFRPRSRNAFTITMSDETDIAMAATNGVTKPAMATGIAIAL